MKSISQADLDKLRAMFPVTPTKELVPVFGWSARAIEHQARKHRIRKVIRYAHNKKPIGTLRITRDGYAIIKVADGRYIEKHRALWMEAHGAIPAGHVIIFADGNRTNFAIENLVCVSRADLAILNKNQKYGREIAQNVLLLTKIKNICKTK